MGAACCRSRATCCVVDCVSCCCCCCRRRKHHDRGDEDKTDNPTSNGTKACNGNRDLTSGGVGGGDRAFVHFNEDAIPASHGDGGGGSSGPPSVMPLASSPTPIGRGNHTVHPAEARHTVSLSGHVTHHSSPGAAPSSAVNTHQNMMAFKVLPPLPPSRMSQLRDEASPVESKTLEQIKAELAASDTARTWSGSIRDSPRELYSNHNNNMPNVGHDTSFTSPPRGGVSVLPSMGGGSLRGGVNMFPMGPPAGRASFHGTLPAPISSPPGCGDSGGGGNSSPRPHKAMESSGPARDEYKPQNRRCHLPYPVVDTTVVEEIPAREPDLTLRPKRSAMKGAAAARPPSKGPPTRPKPKMIKMARIESDKENIPDYYDHPSEDSDGEIHYRDDDDTDDMSTWSAKVARNDSLARFLSNRPHVSELIDRNILPAKSEQEKMAERDAFRGHLSRRLSLRPTAEELEQRNILVQKQTDEQRRKDREEKKRTLLRKLSFRPTVEELRERKIIKFSDYVEVTDAHEYDRRADKPWTRLTPKDKASIRKELNEYKSGEMDVHVESKHLTRFHRP